MALQAGTELVFSPVRHPQSNSFVERFHQENQRHVWQDTYLADVAAVQTQADAFFADYRHSRYHRALAGASPAEVHARIPPRLLPSTTTSTAARLPITAGRLHFLRRVTDKQQVSVLNVLWDVPTGVEERGVWVTVDRAPAASTLTVYDAAPDAATRQCLARYPFPVNEPVIPREPTQAPRPVPVRGTSLAQLVFAPLYLGAALIEALLGQSRPADQTVPP